MRLPIKVPAPNVMNSRRRPTRAGFTLTEALVALSLTAMAGAVLLVSAQSALDTGDEALEQTIALGMAQQLIDEALGATYCAKDASPTDTFLGRNSYEDGGLGRERYSDTDDYNGLRISPAEDRFGSTLGTGNGAGTARHANFRLRSNYFTNWRQEVDIYYVSDSNPSVRLTGTSTSNSRAVEVRITRTDSAGRRRELAKVRRVYSYVQPPS